jgi:hypothetical protein
MNRWIIVSAGIVSAAALFSASCFFLYVGVWNILFNRVPEGLGFAIGVIPFAIMGLIAGALIVRRLAAFLRRHRLSAQAP